MNTCGKHLFYKSNIFNEHSLFLETTSQFVTLNTWWLSASGEITFNSSSGLTRGGL